MRKSWNQRPSDWVWGIVAACLALILIRPADCLRAGQAPQATSARPRLDALRARALQIARQFLAPLDHADRLREALKDQVARVEEVKKASEKALLVREVAEVDLREYVEGTFQQDLETVQGEIALAEADFTRTKERLDRIVGQEKQGMSINPDLLEAFKLDLQRANFSQEQAKTKKTVLLKFSKEKNITERKRKIEEALDVELANKSKYIISKNKLDTLKAELARAEPLSEEKQAVGLLDEAMAIDDVLRAGPPESERDKLIGQFAAKLDVAEQAHARAVVVRTERDYQEVRRRVRLVTGFQLPTILGSPPGGPE